MPLPIFSVGQSQGRPAQHQFFVNALLLGGLAFIVLGLTAFETTGRNSSNAKIAAAACATGIIIAIVCRLMTRGSDTPPGFAGADASSSEDIEVDRKLSKKSVSTIASSTGSQVIYHVPSKSMERVIGDVEQGLPEPVRS